MKFTVKFVSNCSAAIYFTSTNLGLDDVDQIRKETGVDLTLDAIEGKMVPYKINPVLHISEGIARSSGLFKKDSTVEVRVAEQSLNQFCKKTLVLDRNKETDAIKMASFEWELDEALLLSHWANDGYPLT